MKVIGYTRVSTSDQVEGVSLDAQHAKITAYCDLHGLELVKVFSDEGISAKDTNGRPEVQKALALIREKKIGGLVVFKLDRLVRNTKDAIEIAALCKAIRYLRLDTIEGTKNPAETLERYRALGALRGTQVGRKVFYRRVELDEFLDRVTDKNPR